MPSKRLNNLCIDLFALIFLLNALMWLLSGYASPSFYKATFNHLPEQTALYRYAASLSLRGLYLLAGLGLLLRLDLARKTGFILSIITVITIYWKHPEAVVAKAIQATRIPEELLSNFQGGLSEFTNMLVWIICGMDVVFSLLFLYFFTRPAIKEQFKKP